MANGNSNHDGRCELVLSKQAHRWVFRYAPGEESAVLRALAHAARDPEQSFDWFDAAVLSQRMGDQMHSQLKHMVSGWITKP